MKIIKLNGLIKLEADGGKVLTTITPSSVRTKRVYLGISDSVENYIEIDEVAEINVYEEPDVYKPDQIINGYSLSEAYHHLLNENRVLKDENKKHGELIDMSLMITDRLYCLLEPLIPSECSEDTNNPVINMYAEMVQKELKTIEQVPEKYRAEVERLMV